MSYVTEHACPSTLLLIHLRNARDLVKAACITDPDAALQDLSPETARRVEALVKEAFGKVTEAIDAVEVERGNEPFKKTGH